MERITDLRPILAQRLGKHFVNEIVEYIRQYPEDFGMLYPLISCSEEKIAWRAAWVCERLSEQHPEWFTPHYEDITDIILTSPYTGLRRCLLSILHTLPVPGEFPIRTYDYCIRQMLSPEEAIANQALCIKLALKLGNAEPDLLEELKAYLENAQPEYYSAGVKSVIKNTLKQIARRKA